MELDLLVIEKGEKVVALFVESQSHRFFLRLAAGAASSSLLALCARAARRERKDSGAISVFCSLRAVAARKSAVRSNHFLLVIETPQPTLVRGMQWMLGTYTARFNARACWTSGPIVSDISYHDAAKKRRRWRPGKLQKCFN